jgi:ParB-like chromosome segregation protein Spo0J
MSDISKTADSRNCNLSFHPLADIFPLMEGEEFDALVADIKANGLRELITVYQNKILDGRNRYRACRALGIEPGLTPFTGDDEAARAFVISKNLRGRHLTAEQREEELAKAVAAQPEKSDRQLARELGVDHKTIGRIRAKGEDVGSIPHVDTRTDTKGRKQPAKKKGKKRRRRRRFYIDTSDGRRLYEDEARAHLKQMQTQRAADSARVAKVLIDRVGVENLTLVYAAMFLKSGEVYLDEIINIPGTYGAEVCAKANDGNYTVADFFAKHGNGPTKRPEAKQPVRKPLKPDPRIIAPELADRVGRFAHDLSSPSVFSPASLPTSSCCRVSASGCRRT